MDESAREQRMLYAETVDERDTLLSCVKQKRKMSIQLT